MTKQFKLAHSPSFAQRVFLRLMGSTIPTGGEIASGVTRFAGNYSTSYALGVGEGKFILIDSGMDKNATEIQSFLASYGATSADVVAVFLTHAHPDHFAGLKQFPNALVYVSEQDKAVLEGTAPADGLLPRLAGKLKESAVVDTSLLRTIADEQVVTIGSKTLSAYAVPGHTQGSMAYVVDDVLFVGDALTFGKGRVIKPPVPMSYSSKLGVESLRTLLAKFEEKSVQPRIVVPTHSGDNTFEALKKHITQLY